jgi:hypothetical protein
MPGAGLDQASRSHAHYKWAGRYCREGDAGRAISHIGRAISYAANRFGSEHPSGMPPRPRQLRFGSPDVTEKDDSTIHVEQGSAVVNFGTARLYTDNLVNCIAIGGSFSYGDGVHRGAFLTHEEPDAYMRHQQTLRAISLIMKERVARVDRVVLFHSERPAGTTVSTIVDAMRSFCAQEFDTQVAVELYEQADLAVALDPTKISGFFAATATVCPTGHAVGRAQLREPTGHAVGRAQLREPTGHAVGRAQLREPTGHAVGRAQLREPPLGTFEVGVEYTDRTDKGSKVYVCHACTRQTGTYAVAHRNDPDAFGHFYNCPNHGKLPVEPNEPTAPSVR